MATESSPPPSSPLSESPPQDQQDAAHPDSSPKTSRTSPDDDKAAPDKPREPIAIPPITPIASQQDLETLARGLEGRFVDEFGNVLDWDGTVLGHVRGDLPSMVGRPVSARGQVVDADGQVAGYVSENFVPPAGAAASSSPPQPSSRKPLDRGLRVDEAGTIFDHEGVPVGKIMQPKGSPRPGESRRGQGSQHHPGTSSCSPATPSPSEVCLDVKSTHDGIQLIIKIPTVFHACSAPPPPPPPS
ncbi:hypothetical protein HRG_005956 [Hirsutella rhossiliensis]|uniref:Uncharacterized protein n=1 Tax=Hirsutella rhossiliensis TaxID=111463 RepID=A0A9P8N031_9HYPO|nr:uncharacterized protein HRG_05956 [Hirsutella rhossiliensis]KAH0963446.1 hypothetical protein HRG_05956 [Hirsutella rhossiliensis]